ncbi:hypothetical protein T01_553 [Trichinella spiralis]|uniref:Uncharacterized protein n=1 Tax=Trichinella spiralis TaxID=6334 RepID=A0A0V0ZET3_TRISP|nr:hypothetical protein T01_553 [Trichinella spiralis]
MFDEMKNDHFIEFYAVHDLNYSLSISTVPTMWLFDSVFVINING